MFRTNRMVFFCQILLISISTTAWGLAVSPNPPLLRIQSNVQKDSVIVDIENNTTNMTLLLSLTLPTGIGYYLGYETKSGEIKSCQNDIESGCPPYTFKLLNSRPTANSCGCESHFSFSIDIPEDFKKLRWLHITISAIPVSDLSKYKAFEAIKFAFMGATETYEVQMPKNNPGFPIQ